VSHNVEGVNTEPVTTWLADRAVAVAPPLDFRLIAGGHSNLTFEVTDQADGHWVLRRPPLGQVLATAHDMTREHRIISALAPTDVPVAPVVGLCTDESVNGSPFYVMDFVDGTVVRDEATAATLDSNQRRRASESIVDVLAAIHSVDVDAVGLGDLGRRDGYVERQLSRWYRQYQGSKEQTPGMDFPAVDEVYERLSSRIPDQHDVAIVHGDYRLDNCMLGPDGSVAAVLDWELCTLGDPLADVGLLWVYWADPDEPSALPQASPTAGDGFLRKNEAIERYAQASGRDLSDIAFFQAFGYWKLTCIIAGVYARYAGGAMGSDTDPRQVAGFETMVGTLAALAEESAGRVAS
jgi:aminoglycoside phosphotransferase (APT) family kinase protein